ncbi:hypothetical protein AZE42_08212 [Rhizopogon vesiculosus]|uniref:Uncharacterized protein n=1 Tax=Rhizopogon vesiculosus TaxID=180088 RepID=A0A1J8QWI3_9AGAM|nr:hypothetical protein AZE42_08212 [Rhizopogon vesiculosus]
MPVRQCTDPSPYDSRTSETDPLVAGKASRRYSVSINQWALIARVALLAILITGVIFASVFPISSCNDHLNPDDRDRIRKEWDVERRHHQEEAVKRSDIEHRWRVEDDERIHLREQWMRETEEHERSLRETIRRETQEKGARRAQWATEIKDHERNLNEAIRRENQEKEARRAQWATEEVEQHNRDIEERQRREKEEHQRLNIHWTDPESHTCTTYGTREYTGRLANIPEDYDRRVEACMAIPIQIHGVGYKANWCEDHGPSNMIGHWKVDQHEPECTSYWSSYEDLGCVSQGSGQRRIEHYLENIPSGGDQREFCATTPASFRGMHFMGAQFCFQKHHFGGMYGQWVIDDESCN